MKLVSVLLTLVLLLTSINVSALATETTTPEPEKIISEPVTAGVTLTHYRWPLQSGPANIYMLTVDLTNPHVEVDAIIGSNKITHRQTVSAMAQTSGAVAAVNADFFNTQAEGAPIGPTSISGRLVTSPAHLDGIYALGITTDRTAHIEPMSFTGTVTARNGQTFPLAGLNKTTYWEQPSSSHSHANKLHLYDDMWGKATRGNDSYTTPTELLIKDAVVIDVSIGSYFDFAVPTDHHILRGHGAAAQFLINNFTIGDPVDIDYSISPDRNWSMLVGGHALLVDGGIAIPYTKDLSPLGGVRARTAAGICSNGTTLFLVGIEGGSTHSAGLSLANLSKLFEHLGVYRAINLDGGGSATMVARPLGEFESVLTFRPEQSAQRSVVNAIGLFSAASPGPVSGLMLDGTTMVLIGEQASYSAKAYDQYYNPVDVADLPLIWDSNFDLKDNVLIATTIGQGYVSVSANDLSVQLPIGVIGKQHVQTITLAASQTRVVPGSTIRLETKLTCIDGSSRTVPADLIDWELYQLTGNIDSTGTLTVHSTGPSDSGFIIARYDGFSAPVHVTFANTHDIDSLQTLDHVSLQVHPHQVTGSIRLTTDPESSRSVAQLSYDFTGAPATSAAYIRFDDKPSISASAETLLVDMYGTNEGQWVRAELTDSAGVLHRVDLSPKVDWSGWNTINAKLSPDYAYPVTLDRIYVVDDRTQTRPNQGSLLLKDIRVQSRESDYICTHIDKTLMLRAGDTELSIDGVSTQMDVAPVIVNDRTLVPVRFISQALDALVYWCSDTRNATVVRGDRWIDLWPDDTIMVTDGVRYDLDVPAQLVSGRTMIPLRAVAEALDLDVLWDGQTQTITLW